MKTKYSGVAQGLRMMYAEDGAEGLVQGNGSNVIRVVPASPCSSPSTTSSSASCSTTLSFRSAATTARRGSASSAQCSAS